MSHQTDNNTNRSTGTDAPAPGNAPVPYWLAGLLGIIMCWAILYVERYAGAFHPKVYAPFESYDAVVAANPVPVFNPRFEAGQEIYSLYCASCHQNDGLGNAIQAPPIAGSDWVTNSATSALIRIVLHGLQGPITINGKEYYYNNVMLPWKDTLSDEQIACVLTFIRQNKEWGNNVGPVLRDEVQTIRQADSSRDIYWTAEELLKQ